MTHDLINDYDLHSELRERTIEETGNTDFWPGHDPNGMDEGSDATDPEEELYKEAQELQQEAEDRTSFIQAVSGAPALEETRQELEKARMVCEDFMGLR